MKNPDLSLEEYHRMRTSSTYAGNPCDVTYSVDKSSQNDEAYNTAMQPPCIDELYDYLKDVYHKKNHDYGNSFEDGLDEDGLIFSKMHLMEKYNRFKKLITETNQVNGEGIRDSLLDMANYAIMTVHWLDKQKCK